MESWPVLGTLIATVYFMSTVLKQFLPEELYENLTEFFIKIVRFCYPYITISIEESDGFKVSDVYQSVQIYLSSRSSAAAARLKLNRPKNSNEFTFTIDKNEQIVDEFEGIKTWWTFRAKKLEQPMLSYRSRPDEKRSFVLKFHKKQKKKVLDVYIPHMMAEAKVLQLKNRQRKLYINKGNDNSYVNRKKLWTEVVFEHPATFSTLALHPHMKADIIQDLIQFQQGEDYYKKVGRAWKRGYLLYGPPGTGKSSMIAAIANLLEYDIYDLELTEVKNNTELRKLLMAATSKSIIVIEDVDCSLDLSNRKKKPKQQKEKSDDIEDKDEKEESKVTLSGLLNFTDGLWSACGSERIIIFTTNHLERLDPALVRSGRMDKRIHLSFCCFEAFKVLASNYLGLEDHPLFPQIQMSMEEAQITPADVGEELMRSRHDPTLALRNLIHALKKSEESKGEKKTLLANGDGKQADGVEAENSSQV